MKQFSSMYLCIYQSICLSVYFMFPGCVNFHNSVITVTSKKALRPEATDLPCILVNRWRGYPDHVINLAGFAWAKVVHICRKAYGGLTVAVGFWTIATLFAWAFGPATVYAWKTAPVRRVWWWYDIWTSLRSMQQRRRNGWWNLKWIQEHVDFVRQRCGNKSFLR